MDNIPELPRISGIAVIESKWCQHQPLNWVAVFPCDNILSDIISIINARLCERILQDPIPTKVYSIAELHGPHFDQHAEIMCKLFYKWLNDTFSILPHNGVYFQITPKMMSDHMLLFTHRMRRLIKHKYGVELLFRNVTIGNNILSSEEEMSVPCMIDTDIKELASRLGL